MQDQRALEHKASATGEVTADPSPFTVALISAFLFVAFGSYIAWMADRWWRDEYYGHGLFLPIISGWLIYRRLNLLRRLPRTDHFWGLPFILAGLALHVAASTADINFPSGFGLVLTIFGLAAWLWGWPIAKAVAFPVGYLVFAVPLGRLLVDRVGQPMQVLAASLGGTFANMLGIVTVIEGTSLKVEGYTFAVAAACSGLKSVIAMTALAALYAYLVDAAWWKRALIVIGSVPISVLANAGRVTTAVVIGKALGPAAADGFVHTASGALVFLLAFLGLMALGGLLGCNRLQPEA